MALPLYILVLIAALIGFLVAVVTGLVASLLMRVKIRPGAITIDGLLGAIAFPVAFWAAMVIPWHSTVTYHSGDSIVTSTMNHYQNPYLPAYLAAMILPILHELRRAIRETRKQPSKLPDTLG
jgi:hypothetical protein